MQIIFPLKDFSFSIFPDLKKFSDNIDSNTETIKDFLASFYTFGPFVPDVSIQDGIVTIDINTENIDKYYDEYQKAVNLCEQNKFSEAKPVLKKLIK